jgi:DHA2 family multidrug resistance protein
MISDTMTAISKPSLTGNKLALAGLLLAAANFIVVLDMTIANVSLPHIAGGLAVSSNEGTYVITSYAVAEAISVPLTGWLATRFGTLRVFAIAVLMFGLFSGLCGLANSLGFLILGRILQGLAGGPIMPLSQTLMMLVFPKEKQMTAMGIWAMTTLIAPILGPIFGGYICDNWGWP